MDIKEIRKTIKEIVDLGDRGVFCNIVNGGHITKVVPMLGKNSYLTVAHRSGEFGGLKSWNDIEEVPIKRDGTPNSFWRDNTLTMLEKVAVSQALRIVFNIKEI